MISAVTFFNEKPHESRASCTGANKVHPFEIYSAYFTNIFDGISLKCPLSYLQTEGHRGREKERERNISMETKNSTERLPQLINICCSL